jgi:uncharacterized protein (TIGR03435 family)
MYRVGHLAARSMALSNLAFNVSRWTDRVVVDRTGLDGRLDWDVQWIPDDLTAALRSRGSLARALATQVS